LRDIFERKHERRASGEEAKAFEEEGKKSQEEEKKAFKVAETAGHLVLGF
jgi:hypothetical protein